MTKKLTMNDMKNDNKQLAKSKLSVILYEMKDMSIV
jgi:hypothetical protein